MFDLMHIGRGCRERERSDQDKIKLMRRDLCEAFMQILMKWWKGVMSVRLALDTLVISGFSGSNGCNYSD